MSRIEKFVLDSYGTRDPDVTQLFSPSKRLKLRPYFELDWKLLKAGIKPESLPVTELPVIVADLNSNLSRSVMETLNPEHEYVIAFDQLDLGFNPNEADYVNRLIGLLLAAKDLNQMSRACGKKLFVSIFLRDDIYQTLQFEDKNKLTENFMEMIEWDTPRAKNTLKSLMEKRFKTRLAEDGEELTWESIFDETKEMTGHQSKYQHIIDRTFLRPRDIIRFCNGILNEYKGRVSPEDSESIFDNHDITSARSLYSEYFKNELDDEVHKHIPHYNDYLDALRTVGKWQFTSEEYKAALNRLYQDKYSCLEVLKEMYEFSIVGFYRPGGRGYGGSEYVFRYREPVSRYDPTASRHRVHPALIEHLGLKRI